MKTQASYTAFQGGRIAASGELERVIRKARKLSGAREPVLVFDDATGVRVEIDGRGSVDEIASRVSAGTIAAQPDTQEERGRGRPKLGVISREVTLLPRHWEWLNAQPGGASAALRRLVEAARRTSQGADAKRRSQEATYRFLSVIAGDFPGYQEALRWLYRGDRQRFDEEVENWPNDVRDYAKTLAAAAMAHE